MDILHELADYWHREHDAVDGDDRHPWDMFATWQLISHDDLWQVVTRSW